MNVLDYNLDEELKRVARERAEKRDLPKRKLIGSAKAAAELAKQNVIIAGAIEMILDTQNRQGRALLMVAKHTRSGFGNEASEAEMVLVGNRKDGLTFIPPNELTPKLRAHFEAELEETEDAYKMMRRRLLSLKKTVEDSSREIIDALEQP